jgi:hypothetical protein
VDESPPSVARLRLGRGHSRRIKDLMTLPERAVIGEPCEMASFAMLEGRAWTRIGQSCSAILPALHLDIVPRCGRPDYLAPSRDPLRGLRLSGQS